MFNLLKKVQLNKKLQALDANFDKLYFVNRSNIEKDWKAKKNRNGKIFFHWL
jgi:transposase